MRGDIPSGTVTFLFTDIEGSTRFLHDLGAADYAAALDDHRRVLRDAFTHHAGVEVDTQGDAFFVAFPTAPGALAAASEAQAGLASGPIRVRMGIHTGTPLLTAEGYVGPDVHRAARIASAGHGGQVLVSAATAALAGAPLRDLGQHRLKDLSAPEHIYQLGDADFPPLKTLYQTNLPVPLTPFLGREGELARVIELAGQPGIRLLTLTGPGGTGKTRLAQQSAAEMGDRYEGGVWWVPLAPLRDSRLVLETAGRVVGSKNGLAEHIGDKSMLLVLDNFEQVIDAASDVAGVLGACPNLRVLATSREALRVYGEHAYAVPPLADSDGEALFLARATAADPNFVDDGAVAEICRRLDELPLAIELAAARVNALSSTQILARLDKRLPLLTSGARDAPERQRTLRGAIEWSYDLLSEQERRLFARLSVFRGGCTLEAAEAVAGADLDGLQSLVDKSLVRRRGDRYLMLETLREYGAERLEATDEVDEFRRKHTQFFLDFAHAAEPHLQEDELAWLERLDLDADNLRAAFDQLEDQADWQATLELGGAIQRFWYLRGHFAEGRRRLEAALAADERPSAARAKALRAMSVLLLNLGEPLAARGYAEAALALSRQLGDRWAEAYATMMVANCAAEIGVYEDAVTYHEKAAVLFGDLGDDRYVQLVLSNLSWVMGELGDHARDVQINEELLARGRASGNERMVSQALASLSIFARDEGRFEDARAMAAESIAIDHRRGDIFQMAITVGRLASILARDGERELAARLLSYSIATYERLGSRAFGWVSERDEKTIELIRSALGQETADRAMAAGRALTVDEIVELTQPRADRGT